MKKFSFNGLDIFVHPQVYDPAEDSFDLLNCLNVDESFDVFEIGTGCGLVSLECVRVGASVVCSDINPYAVLNAEYNYDKNTKSLKGFLDIRYGDLFNVLRDGELFDVILFNPPYLPTCKSELVGGSGWFDISVDGGADGLLHTRRFIMGLKGFLKMGGFAFFVFSSLSDREGLHSFLNEYGFDFKVVNSRCFDDEVLDIYRIEKKKK